MPDINIQDTLNSVSSINTSGVKISISESVKGAAAEDQKVIKEAEKNVAALREEYQKQVKQLRELGGRFTGKIHEAIKEKDEHAPWEKEAKRAKEQLRHLNEQKRDTKENARITKSGDEKINGKNGFVTLEQKSAEAQSREASLKEIIDPQIELITRVTAMAKTVKTKLANDLKQETQKIYERVPKKKDGAEVKDANGNTVYEKALPANLQEMHTDFLNLLDSTDFTISVPPTITADTIEPITNQFNALFDAIQQKEDPTKSDVERNNARVQDYSKAKTSIIKEREENERGNANDRSVLDQAMQDYLNSDKNKPLGKDNNYRPDEH